jgi:hypothetical protein
MIVVMLVAMLMVVFVAMPVRLPVMMIMIMIVSMAGRMLPVSTVLRIERRFDRRKPRAEPAQHVFDHMVAADAQPIADDLNLDMTIANVPGEPRQFMAARGGNFDQGLGPADDAHDATVVEHEAVAVAQSGRARQVEQEDRATLAGQDNAAAMPVVRIEQNLIDCTGAVPMAGRLDGVCALHVVLECATD